MSQRKHDSEAQKLLDDLAQMQSADQELSPIEPPAMIDQAVKNMARRAVASQPSPNTGKLRWIAGLSTASVALIALGISLVQSPVNPPIPATQAPASLPASEARSAEAAFLSKKEQPEATGSQPRKSTRSEPARASAQDATTARSRFKSEAAPAELKDQAFSASQDMKIDAAAPASSALALDESVSEATGNREVFDLDKQPDSASAWLDLVRQLVDQGLEEDARQQFQAFRSAHPDYPLPLWAQEWSENLDE